MNDVDESLYDATYSFKRLDIPAHQLCLHTFQIWKYENLWNDSFLRDGKLIRVFKRDATLGSDGLLIICRLNCSLFKGNGFAYHSAVTTNRPPGV